MCRLDPYLSEYTWTNYFTCETGWSNFFNWGNKKSESKSKYAFSFFEFIVKKRNGWEERCRLFQWSWTNLGLTYFGLLLVLEKITRGNFTIIHLEKKMKKEKKKQRGQAGFHLKLSTWFGLTSSKSPNCLSQLGSILWFFLTMKREMGGGSIFFILLTAKWRVVI